MQDIRFLTDSASDITPDEARALGITVIPFPVNVGDRTLISQVDFDNEGFYQMLESSEEIPTHSQITVYEFQKIFTECFESGARDVINTTINSEGSGTYSGACLGAQMFYEEHPEAVGKMRIHNLDGQTYTCGYGYAVMEGARMAQRGVPVDEVLAFMRGWLEDSVIYFVPYTLKYAGKSGRIPSAAAFIGELVGLKPVMRIHDHQIVTADKIRGEKKIIHALVEKSCAEMCADSPYIIIYGDHPEDGEALAQAMEDALGRPPEGRCQIGAVIAINAGPRVAGVCFRGKK